MTVANLLEQLKKTKKALNSVGLDYSYISHLGSSYPSMEANKKYDGDAVHFLKKCFVWKDSPEGFSFWMTMAKNLAQAETGKVGKALERVFEYPELFIHNKLYKTYDGEPIVYVESCFFLLKKGITPVSFFKYESTGNSLVLSLTGHSLHSDDPNPVVVYNAEKVPKSSEARRRRHELDPIWEAKVLLEGNSVFEDFSSVTSKVRILERVWESPMWRKYRD